MQGAITLPAGDASASQGTRALTPEQMEKWERDGYLILPQFFGPDVIDLKGQVRRTGAACSCIRRFAGRINVFHQF